MAKCPYCKEKIRRGAVVCKHCGRDLPSKQLAGPINKRAGLLTILILLGLCFLITTISNALKKAEIARDPVAATINAMDTATQKAIPTITKTPRPTSTSVQDGSIQILMDVVGLTKEDAIIAFEKMKSVGYSRLTKLEFSKEMTPLKFYLANTEFTKTTILSFVGSELFGINHGGDKQLYDRDAGGVLDNIQNYVLPEEDKGTYIVLAEQTVKSALKSPSTAKFPTSIFQVNEWKVGRDHDVITVVSWVDAQNSFGAMIRSNFAVQFSYSTNELLYLLLDGQILFGSEH